MTATLLIVDDHALTRAGFMNMLQESGHDWRVHGVSDGESALAHLQRAPVDLLILDLSLPGRSGLDILRHVHRSRPELPILVMSGFPERQYALSVLRAGARGYVCKTGAAEEVTCAVATVLAGRRYLNAEVADLLMDHSLGGGDDRPLHGTLSERELDVFLKLAGGTSVSGIASQLCLSVKTVSTYRARIVEKMGLQTNASMTRYALQQGLLQ